MGVLPTFRKELITDKVATVGLCYSFRVFLGQLLTDGISCRHRCILFKSPSMSDVFGFVLSLQ